nr:hypothetical protein [Rhodoferax sp.]
GAKTADEKGADAIDALVPGAAGVAQPESSELTERAPRGSMGAAAINLRAERRDDGFVCDMDEFV